ncbi:pyridoxamine 5'-phosphate oxidase [Amycolatopsis rubida]|uniref:Pyridoxine/pyridoxamine 5'-phosphate oxidase n=1 Tax=Amycolatopsis rubida TaxID=112413 RepID=A0A1I5W1M1_9PSEU|nr:MULTISPECIES: pyridoxamine 5'-phosphate oxidase [Amycolatopsis]MYW95357.1 pyridoxamine 5'-phosphate oxidase [Amycolatopsis rubida]NEC60346.1 pyridoxamine 5'-phosphate oxidase [Amycolatopsis rubida]OAP28238.1 Pyridoxine/pyridoxamine 5'-phosphate oxidase [Amycolatopsis sp. M39]SFQ13639.1 Pyridoxamine 5'-phosphate oxidase [Amycolatopsis rubida]
MTPEIDEAVVRLPGMRVAYDSAPFDESALAATWHDQLESWLSQAVSEALAEPNAMVLATADAEGRPSSRTVLCKGFDERGVVFYTNYTSAKSHDLTATRYASATFPWYPLHRQVTVRGEVEKVSADETAAYWAQRPRGSQLGAWASPQSRVVDGRRALDNALRNIERRFADVEQIPAPPHWGGWRIRPDFVEFWQGREDRLHDRLRFHRTHDGWHVERLAP